MQDILHFDGSKWSASILKLFWWMQETPPPNTFVRFSLSHYKQAGIELGLTQADTVSLELANWSQIIYFFIFNIHFEMDEQKKQNQTKLHQTKPFKF